MACAQGLSLEFSDRRAVPDTFEGVNEELLKIGARVGPLDFKDRRDDIRALLSKRALDDAEAERIKQHFLLPRDRLLQIVSQAGRAPQVADGGGLITFVDYSRFDRFHVNVGPHGTGGVDEVFQMLWGGGFVVHQRLDDGHTLTLTLDCPDDSSGWLRTYSGIRPHIGSYVDEPAS